MRRVYANNHFLDFVAGAKSHRWIACTSLVSSMLAAARLLLSGVNESEVIAPLHPSNVFTRFADVTSYTAIKCLSPCFPEMATVLPSAEKA